LVLFIPFMSTSPIIFFILWNIISENT
jgi:hypothetical protein